MPEVTLSGIRIPSDPKNQPQVRQAFFDVDAALDGPSTLTDGFPWDITDQLVGESSGKHLSSGYDATSDIAYIRSVNAGDSFTPLHLAGSGVSLWSYDGSDLVKTLEAVGGVVKIGEPTIDLVGLPLGSPHKLAVGDGSPTSPATNPAPTVVIEKFEETIGTDASMTVVIAARRQTGAESNATYMTYLNCTSTDTVAWNEISCIYAVTGNSPLDATPTTSALKTFIVEVDQHSMLSPIGAAMEIDIVNATGQAASPFQNAGVPLGSVGGIFLSPGKRDAASGVSAGIVFQSGNTPFLSAVFFDGTTISPTGFGLDFGYATSGFPLRLPNLGTNAQGYVIARNAAGTLEKKLLGYTSANLVSIDADASGAIFAGAVGIGLSVTPSAPLDVNGLTNTNVIVRGGAASHSLIQFTQTSTSRGYIGYSAGLGLAFFNAAGSTENLLITDAGKVGIGTTNPLYRLHVNGGRVLISPNSETYALGVSYAGTGAFWLGASNSGTPDLLFQNNAGTELARLTNGGTLTVSTSVSTPSLTASANLTAAPVGDWIFNAGGKDILPSVNYDQNLGAIDKKYLTLHAAELWVETLVAQDTLATIGGRILVGPTTTLTADFPSAATSITVKHNQMANGDRVYLESNGKVEFLAITSGPSGAGPYVYTVTRNLDGSGANDWFAGDAIFNTGQTGNGFIDLYSLRGVKAGTEVGPTIVGNVRNSSTYNDWTSHWAIGNLNGLYGYSSTTFGVGLGQYAAGVAHITIDATNGYRIFSGLSTVVASWSNAGVITVGEVAASKSNVLISAGALSLRNNTTERIGLSAAGILTIKDSAGTAVMTFDASAGAEITNKLTMPGASSAIAIGSTPPTSASAGTGLWLDRTGLYGLASGVVHAKFDATTGKITAGAGNVVMDVNGLQLIAGTTFSAARSVSFVSSIGGDYLGELFTGNDPAESGHTVFLQSDTVTGRDSFLTLKANAASGRVSNVSLGAYDTGGLQAYMQVESADGALMGVFGGSTFAIDLASGPVMTGVLKMGGGLLTSDTAPLVGAIQAQSAYAQASTNTTGGDLVISGGLGRRLYTIVSNVAGAVTVTTTVNGTAVALASTTNFTLGSDDTAPQLAVTATNLANAINANSTLNTKVTALASGANVYLTKKAADYSLTIATNQAGRISVTSGTDGGVTINRIAVGAFQAGVPRFYSTSTQGLVITAGTGSAYDMLCADRAGNTVFRIPAATSDLDFGTSGNLFLASGGGSVSIRSVAPTCALDINADLFRLRTAKTPASAAASGNAGDICWDSTYFYICIATNTWHRALHATW